MRKIKDVGFFKYQINIQYILIGELVYGFKKVLNKRFNLILTSLKNAT